MNIRCLLLLLTLLTACQQGPRYKIDQLVYRSADHGPVLVVQVMVDPDGNILYLVDDGWRERWFPEESLQLSPND